MKKILLLVPVVDVRVVKFAEFFCDSSYSVILISDKKVSETFKSRLSKLSHLEIHILYKENNFPSQILYDPRRLRLYEKYITKDLDFIYVRDIFLAYTVLKKFKDKNSIYVDIADDYVSVLKNTTSLLKKVYGYLINTNRIEKFVLKNANKITFVCSEASDHFTNRHQLKDIDYLIIPNTPFYDNSIAEFDNVSKRNKDVIYTGTIDEGIRDFETILNSDRFLRGKISIDCFVFNSNTNKYILSLKEQSLKLNNIKLSFYEPVNNHQYRELLKNYRIGLIPHKRNEITDYTIPNKIYDYWLEEMVILSSDNPAIVKDFKQLPQVVFYDGESPQSFAEKIEIAEGWTGSFENFKFEDSFFYFANKLINQ